MKEPETQAEGFKQAESVWWRGPETGGGPVSIRKRGYHRALKRREPWALHKKAVADRLNDLAKIFYGHKEQGQERCQQDMRLMGLAAWLPKIGK
jgi:hypothetical protein